MKAGDTFLIPDGIGTHLNFVLAVLPDRSLVLAHFTKRRPHSDITCVVSAGEHPFITWDTVIRYDQAYVCPADRVENLMRLIIRMREPLDATLLRRILQGAIASPQTPDKIKAVLRTILE